MQLWLDNKLDLEQNREVEADVAERYAEDNGIYFIETSAKTAQNVSELFMKIAKKLPKTTRVRSTTGYLGSITSPTST
eukprot:EC715053.1.p2 GENE.EC715053.1~~EC715053.1.p2  ORF type:complete len:78 (+),score=11.18 EC715053.1:354-587(+)